MRFITNHLRYNTEALKRIMFKCRGAVRTLASKPFHYHQEQSYIGNECGYLVLNQ